MRYGFLCVSPRATTNQPTKTMTATDTPVYITRRLGNDIYICPNTEHWAGWQDSDAIRRYGKKWPDSSVKSEHLNSAKTWDDLIAMIDKIWEMGMAADWYTSAYAALSDIEVTDDGNFPVNPNLRRYPEKMAAMDAYGAFLKSLV